MVKLGGGLVVPGAPRLAAIEADGGSLIRSENHAGGIFRVDPDLVVVVASGRAANDGDGLAAIFGAVERDVGHIDDVRILRIDGDSAEIPGTAREARVSVGESPSVTAIVGTIKSRAFGLDERIDALAVRRDGEADASSIAFGQAAAL